VISEPTSSTLTGTPPNLTYTPFPNYNGPDSFTFIVNDGTVDSQLATVTTTVIPVNDPPVAKDDAAATEQGQAIVVKVLANDWDVDGDAFHVASVTQPDNGSATINKGETVAYTPAPGFSGTDSFTYTITDGNGGTATATVRITVISPITLKITSPSEGETISRPDIMVEGTIYNKTGNETGVTVNGILAIVYGYEFVANHAPLQEGENTITVTATDTDGNTAIRSTTVYAQTTGDYIKLSSNTESGISPLETVLRIDGSFSFTKPILNYVGPGKVELPESTSEEYTVTMTKRGIYYFTAQAKDAQDVIYTDSIAIEVLDKAELDALLRGKWRGMNKALAQNDIDSAVSYFDDFSRGAYRETFIALSSLVSQIAEELSDIEFIWMMKNSAEYDIRTIREGKEYSFHLLFVRDKDGLWKIRSF